MKITLILENDEGQKSERSMDVKDLSDYEFVGQSVEDMFESLNK